MFHTSWANTVPIPLDHMGLDTVLPTVSTCCVLVLAGYWRYCDDQTCVLSVLTEFMTLHQCMDVYSLRK